MSDDLCVAMEIPPDVAFASSLAGTARTLAERMGFGRRENLRFQLAVEEFCICLAGLAQPGQPLRADLTGKRHLLRAAFDFRAADLSLGGLNITACTVTRTDGAHAGDLGLLLAAKAADRFHLEHLGADRFVIVAEVDRAYPVLAPVNAPQTMRPPFRLIDGRDPARLTQAAALALAAYPAWQLPSSFRTPEKFADMVLGGQVACAISVDAAGQTAGFLAWSPCSEQALAFSGPFVFASGQDRAEVARQVLDGFLEAVARERYVIVLSFRATDDLIQSYFEPLGVLQACADDGCGQQPVIFRHLREDAGLAVWCSPMIEDFLRASYDRLAMPRDLLPVEEPTSRSRRDSLLGTTLDRQRDLAELQPFLDGRDMAENLAAHVAAIRDKGINRILCYMDLSRAWEAALAGDLIRAGFVPKLVLPYAGQADKVVWQHEQAR